MGEAEVRSARATMGIQVVPSRKVETWPGRLSLSGI